MQDKNVHFQLSKIRVYLFYLRLRDFFFVSFSVCSWLPLLKSNNRVGSAFDVNRVDETDAF